MVAEVCRILATDLVFLRTTSTEGEQQTIVLSERDNRRVVTSTVSKRCAERRNKKAFDDPLEVNTSFFEPFHIGHAAPVDVLIGVDVKFGSVSYSQRRWFCTPRYRDELFLYITSAFAQKREGEFSPINITSNYNKLLKKFQGLHEILKQ
jgi:hypothetical protein